MQGLRQSVWITECTDNRSSDNRGSTACFTTKWSFHKDSLLTINNTGFYVKYFSIRLTLVLKNCFIGSNECTHLSYRQFLCTVLIYQYLPYTITVLLHASPALPFRHPLNHTVECDHLYQNLADAKTISNKIRHES